MCRLSGCLVSLGGGGGLLSRSSFSLFSRAIRISSRVGSGVRERETERRGERERRAGRRRGERDPSESEEDEAEEEERDDSEEDESESEETTSRRRCSAWDRQLSRVRNADVR